MAMLAGFAGWIILFAISVLMLSLWRRGVIGFDNFKNAGPPWFLAWSAATVVYGIIFSGFWSMRMREITAQVLKWVAWLCFPVIVFLSSAHLESTLLGSCFLGILFVPFLIGNMCCSVCPNRKGAFKLYYTTIAFVFMALVVYSAEKRREEEKKK